MSKFNTLAAGTLPPKTPFGTTDEVTATHEGAPAHSYDDKSALFLLGVSNFVSEGSFYEGKDERDNRFRELSEKVAVADPDWFARFVKWLRHDANMRSASLAAAVDGVGAMVKAGIPGGRAIINSVLVRADEPGEAVAYARSRFGRLPKPIKRGIADAVQRLYTERNLLKYDSSRKGYTFGDVVELTHPTPAKSGQGILFKYAIDKKHSDVEVPEGLQMLEARKCLTFEAVLENPNLLAEAGLTWEALSSMSDEGMSARVWEALIPTLGYMATLRNLAGFKRAGVSDSVMASVRKRLADPKEVAKSRQLPMRFLSAYQAVQGDLKLSAALEEALDASLANVPSLDGNTLILVDRSGSMFWHVSEKSQLTWADSAALFGSALAVRAEKATLVQYGTSAHEVHFNKGDSVLPLIKKFCDMGGTDLVGAVNKYWDSKYTRVIVITDEQDSYWGRQHTLEGIPVIPARTPKFTFNLAGNGSSSDTLKNSVTIGGGLTDASFSMIEHLETSRKGDWPF